MPLVQGKSPGAISANIAELVKAGHPQKQAEAIAYAVARRNGAKDDVAALATAANSGVPVIARKARDAAHSKGNIRRLIRDLVEFFHEEEDEDDASDDALSDEAFEELNTDASPDKLSERTRAEIGTIGSKKREELPDADFLEPASKKYPVKKDGKYDRKLLIAAAREARMHGHEDLAKRADVIRAREFSEAEDAATLDKAQVDYSRGKGDERCKNCQHFLPAIKGCEIVKGEIEPEFWCERFASVTAHDTAHDTALVMDWSSDAAKRAAAAPLALDWAVGAVLRTKNHADVAFAFDRESMRSIDKDGRLHVAKAHISKANICEYYGQEIPGWQELGLDPQRKYKMLRDPAELKKAEKTFNNLPILSTHLPTDVDNHPKDETIGASGSDAEFDGAYLNNSLAFWTREALEGIESGDQQELSCAYSYTPDMTPGTFLGESYHGVMRNIVGNHIALVNAGRAGKDVKVADSFDEHLWIKIESAIEEMVA